MVGSVCVCVCVCVCACAVCMCLCTGGVGGRYVRCTYSQVHKIRVGLGCINMYVDLLANGTQLYLSFHISCFLTLHIHQSNKGSVIQGKQHLHCLQSICTPVAQWVRASV